MSIADLVALHTHRPYNEDGARACQCGHYIGNHDEDDDRQGDRHIAHLAEVLESHMREREARAWSTGFHKGRKAPKDISAWPKNPYRAEQHRGGV